MAQPQSCIKLPPASFDVREDPFNLSASERGAIMDVIHAFALTWDLRDEVNLPLLFIEGDGADDSLQFTVCDSTGGIGGTGLQIGAASSRDQLTDYFEDAFQYVIDNTTQARHFISNAVIKNYRSGDVKVVASLLVTLQRFELDDEEEPLPEEPSPIEPLPIVDYTGMIEAILTKEWGGVWKFRSLIIWMDTPTPTEEGIFRGR